MSLVQVVPGFKNWRISQKSRFLASTYKPNLEAMELHCYVEIIVWNQTAASSF